MKIVKDKIKVITKEAKWTSWAELKALSEAGKLGEVLKSGDNIPVTLKNGEEVSFDVGKDESGKIYFVMHDCLKERKPMNDNWTNKGGWEKSDMRRYLNEEVINLLPDELRKIIKPTKIVQVWDGKNGVASVELCKTFDTKEEAEAYITQIYRDYPAPKGRENGPVIIYAGASTEGAERAQLDDEQAEVV